MNSESNTDFADYAHIKSECKLHPYQRIKEDFMGGSIRSFYDLQEFLAADKWALGIKRKHPHVFCDYIWKFEIALRKHEYYVNCHPRNVKRFYWGWRHQKLGIKLGFEIPCNVFDKGLRINHYGLIVVNPKCRIGSFCDIHQGVNIGVGTDKQVPEIGDNVYVAPGVKIFGGITIGDNVMIGANAVVTKSFPDDVVIMGIPAEISEEYLFTC